MGGGGGGLKIGIVRVQAGKLSKKTVRESSRDADGNLHYDGRIKRHAGDCYLVETTVTRSNCGTSSDPKFSHCWPGFYTPSSRR